MESLVNIGGMKSFSKPLSFLLTSTVDLTGTAISAAFSRSTSYAKLAVHVFNAISELVARRTRNSTAYALKCDVFVFSFTPQLTIKSVSDVVYNTGCGAQIGRKESTVHFDDLVLHSLCLPACCGAVGVILRKRLCNCCNRIHRLCFMAVTLLAPGRGLSFSEPVC